MAISKRLRYEILRRDNHTCHYCGGTAPQVNLTIDHVIPRSLGGTNDPSNLVAACQGCNAGKSSTPPDAPLIGAVAAKGDEWSAARNRASDAAAALELRTNESSKIIEQQWTRAKPRNWKNSIRSLMRYGLPVELIPGLVEVALDARGVDDRWRYFCGCAWRKVRDLEEAAGHHATPDAAPDAQAHAPSICSSMCQTLREITDQRDALVEAMDQLISSGSAPYLGRCLCTERGGEECVAPVPVVCQALFLAFCFGAQSQKLKENR